MVDNNTLKDKQYYIVRIVHISDRKIIYLIPVLPIYKYVLTRKYFLKPKKKRKRY